MMLESEASAGNALHNIDKQHLFKITLSATKCHLGLNKNKPVFYL